MFALHRPGYAKSLAKVWLETGFLLVHCVSGLASAPDLLCKEWSTVILPLAVLALAAGGSGREGLGSSIACVGRGFV